MTTRTRRRYVVHSADEDTMTRIAVLATDDRPMALAKMEQVREAGHTPYLRDRRTGELYTLQ